MKIQLSDMKFPEHQINSKAKNALTIIGLTIALAIFLIIAFNMVTYRVDEMHHAVVTQFGKIVKIVVSPEYDTPELRSSLEANNLSNVKIASRKGLFLKIPLIQSITFYDSRLLSLDTDQRDVITRDKKKITLDNFIQWKIVNPALFHISIKTERSGATRIDDIAYSKLNEKIGRTDAHTLISDIEFAKDLQASIVKDVTHELTNYGIAVVDLGIKRTDLPEETYENIFNRMRSERERMAKQSRSEGEEEAKKIRSTAEKEATILEANAYATAEEIKGEGEAEALRIYAEAYNVDPEFYEFWRTLQTYKATLGSNTKIVIPADSDFAKYLLGKE